MNARRLELYELLKPKLDEEPARALVLALPDDPDQLATKEDLKGLEDRVVSKIDTAVARIDSILTRRMITIIGGWTILVGSTVGWVAVLFH